MSKTCLLGAVSADGPSGQELNATCQFFDTLRTRLYALDATYRWKNPARAIYRS